MPYRADFYTQANIIGYSGNLNDFPTVYFRSPWEFGHITQKHPDSQNVGRHRVGNANGYWIGNRIVNGVLKLLEVKFGQVFHESRSTLTAVTPATLGTLALAIAAFPDEKYISTYSDEDFATIDGAAAAKGTMLAELLQTRAPQ